MCPDGARPGQPRRKVPSAARTAAARGLRAALAAFSVEFSCRTHSILPSLHCPTTRTHPHELIQICTTVTQSLLLAIISASWQSLLPGSRAPPIRARFGFHVLSLRQAINCTSGHVRTVMTVPDDS